METEDNCQPPQSGKGERYTLLLCKREALEAKLLERNEELKRLCIAEAELTGTLPPEIPLETGEDVPTFRRRVGTSYTLPENLINKWKSEEEQSSSTLELEYEIQSRITAAALRLANDIGAKKAVRRQRRFEYQENLKRLEELEERLNEIKLSQCGSLKHRKKPRPSADSESSGEPAEGKPANHVVGTFLDVSYQSNTLPHNHAHLHSNSHHTVLKSTKAPQYSLSSLKTSNSDLRGHRPLQRLSNGGHFSYGIHKQDHSSPQYTTLSSCTHLELERLNRHDTAFIMSPHWNPYADSRSLHQYQHLGHLTPMQNGVDVVDHSSQWNRNRFGSLDRKKHMAHSNPCLESRSVEELDILQVDEKAERGYMLAKRGALETMRMKPRGGHAPHHSHTHAIHYQHEAAWEHHPQFSKQRSSPTTAAYPTHHPVSHQPSLVETLLPGQTYPEHNFGKVLPAPPDRALTRTQSLGSVETSKNAASNANIDTRSIKDMYPATSYSQQKSYDLKKNKEKEWYETSLDCPTPSSHRPPSRRLSGHSGYEVKIHDTSVPLSPVSCQAADGALSDHSKAKTEIEHVMFESPKNHMVIQAGKWQPYWETTKPFEMSDFYKYSTKYRKSMQSKQEERQQQPAEHPSPDSPTPSMSPQQKGIYQPLQPMTCQPLDVNGAASEQSPKPTWKPMLSPSGADTSLRMPEESMADTFSSEMIAWYQDKSSVPRSATLV